MTWATQGPAGATGATGATGAQGKQGIQGTQGIQGLQGIQGNPGPAGPTNTTFIRTALDAPATGQTGTTHETTAVVGKWPATGTAVITLTAYCELVSSTNLQAGYYLTSTDPKAEGDDSTGSGPGAIASTINTFLVGTQSNTNPVTPTVQFTLPTNFTAESSDLSLALNGTLNSSEYVNGTTATSKQCQYYGYVVQAP